MKLAWGAKVSDEFREKICEISDHLGIDPSWLMACMHFESGLNPAARNAAGSGATGLIQFMPPVAASLGTTTDVLATMSAAAQLNFVSAYFEPWAHRLHNLGDVYGAILWPAMIGKPDDAVIFDQADPHHPKLYLQNRGLDFNHDGAITKKEIVARVQSELDRGLLPQNVFPDGGGSALV